MSLFSPAVGVMNRLSYPKKFAFIGLMGLLVISLLLFQLTQVLSNEIAIKQAETAALRANKAVGQVVQLMQQHRGMSSAALAGNEALQGKLPAKADAVNNAIRKAESVMAQEGVKVDDGWGKAMAQWKILSSEGLEMTRPANFNEHTAMIGQLLAFNVDMAEHAKLLMDQETDAYYLINALVDRLPMTLEKMGQARAKGAAALARRNVSYEESASYGSEVERILGLKQELSNGLMKAARFNPDIKDKLERFDAEFSEKLDAMLQVVREDVIGGSYSTEPSAYFELATAAINVGYSQAEQVLLPALEELMTGREEVLQRNFWLHIVVAVGVGLIMVYFSVGTYIAVIEAVKSLRDGADSLAKGDLTARISINSRDELRQVADSFNGMANALNQLIGKIKTTSNQVASAAAELASSSVKISGASQQQSDQASGMAAAVEEMTVGIDQISGHANQANEVAEEAGEMADKSDNVVSSSVVEMQRIADVVNESAGIIRDLGARSNEISAIVNAIKEIADQTNLLALNAAIEAARAGESGRGFAVVADEVRKLAERTAKSTQEIAGMIGAIQTGTANAVSSMEDGVARVTEGVNLAEQTGEAIRHLRDSARKTLASIADISHSLREQSSTNSEIARSVEHIARMAEENHTAVDVNTQTARGLEQLAEELKSEVSRFRV